MDDLNLSQKSSHTQTSRQGRPHFDPHLIEDDRRAADAVEKTGYILKRPLDVLLSGLALVMLSPVFLVIALIIKLTSPGPVLFRQ
uniref:sugar transferase n=1 Tax=uncultured Gimesia sp. TaxID=1678688 RepID=UPI002639EFE0